MKRWVKKGKAKGYTSIVKRRARTRQLVVVFDEHAKAEVLARRHVVWPKNVPAKRWYLLPIVRRNKKIKKVMQMDKTATNTQVALRLLSSKNGILSDADCVYAKEVLEVLRHPDKFVFKRTPDIIRVLGWNIMQASSTSVLAQTDFYQAELVGMAADLERDVGVMKKSVEQLLAEKTCDVVAVNTHPGHHAGPKRIMSYCALNNVVIAASFIKRKDPSMKVGVIDIDVHAGDGTHAFIKQNPQLVTKFVSIHCTARFCNMGYDLGSSGCPLKRDREAKVSPQRLNAKIKQVLDTWSKAKLDIVIVSLGFDTLKHDAEAGHRLGFQMLPAHFQDVGHTFAQRSEQMLFIQEGGYNVNETADAFEKLVQGFRRGRKSFQYGADSSSPGAGRN